MSDAEDDHDHMEDVATPSDFFDHVPSKHEKIEVRAVAKTLGEGTLSSKHHGHLGFVLHRNSFVWFCLNLSWALILLSVRR